MTEKLRDWPSFKTEFTLPMRYLIQGSGPGTVILLHGYQDHALSMTRRMGWLDAHLPFQMLAVNAPFPVPVWRPDGFIEAYSWYFRDTSRDIMIIHPADTAARLADLVHSVVEPGTPLVIFGFSQGGYLAPFLAQRLPDTRAIIAVGSGYPAEPYSALDRGIRVNGIHGEKDDRWPLAKSKAAHTELLHQGFKGEFHVLPAFEHKVDPILDPMIRRMACASFGASK